VLSADLDHEPSTHSSLCAERNSTQLSKGALLQCSGVNRFGEEAEMPVQTDVSPCSASSGTPLQVRHSSQRVQKTNIFANMPDVVKKQPSVYFDDPPRSPEIVKCLPHSSQPSRVSPALSPEKRDRTYIQQSTCDAWPTRAEVKPRSAAIDLTFSSDDEAIGEGQVFTPRPIYSVSEVNTAGHVCCGDSSMDLQDILVVGKHSSQHQTPKKTRLPGN